MVHQDKWEDTVAAQLPAAVAATAAAKYKATCLPTVLSPPTLLATERVAQTCIHGAHLDQDQHPHSEADHHRHLAGDT